MHHWSERHPRPLQARSAEAVGARPQGGSIDDATVCTICTGLVKPTAWHGGGPSRWGPSAIRRCPVGLVLPVPAGPRLAPMSAGSAGTGPRGQGRPHSEREAKTGDGRTYSGDGRRPSPWLRLAPAPSTPADPAGKDISCPGDSSRARVTFVRGG